MRNFDIRCTLALILKHLHCLSHFTANMLSALLSFRKNPVLNYFIPYR